MDPMKPDITQTLSLLEEVKEVEWAGLKDNIIFEKDSIIISRGRESVKVKLPLREFRALDTLIYVWRLMLTGKLSPSIADDYLWFAQILHDSKYDSFSDDLITYLIKRNVSRDASESLLETEMRKLGSRISGEILFNGVKLFRVLPR
jgi:hypothetical protein